MEGEDPGAESAGSLSHDDSGGSSDSSSDIAPKMQAQFHNLSAVLTETNENLLSFEFMLQQYRQLARIRPLVAHQKQEEEGGKQLLLNASHLEQTVKLDRLLTDLGEAVEKVASLKCQLGGGSQVVPVANEMITTLQDDNLQLREKCRNLEEKADALKLKCDFLEQECQGKSRLCDQLSESVHRARNALAEEREKSDKLDAKLETERRAAQKIGQDITKYVGQMKSMEDEVLALRKERADLLRRRKALDRSVTRVDMQGDMLTATVTTGEEHCQVLLDQEVERRKLLEVRVLRYEEQVRDYESQLNDLKRGLENLQGELEERCRGVSEDCLPVIPKQTPNDVVVRLETALAQSDHKCQASVLDLKKLRSKCKVLLKQYKEKKRLLDEQDTRISGVKSSLHAILSGSSETENNYRAILCHLGSEVEIAARLMAAYLDVAVKHDPIVMQGRRLGEWFCDIQSLSTWLQSQILAFGKRFWTDREPPGLRSKVIPLPRIPAVEKDDTLSELSMLTEVRLVDEDGSKSIIEVINNQDLIRETRAGAVEHLLVNLQTDVNSGAPLV